jgi:16S rRNA C1402 (ribose-2'-O) methylase RsmI
MNKTKSKFSKKYKISERLIIFSGRKSRQKARKLAKQNSQTGIVVISKKGNPVYWVFF